MKRKIVFVTDCIDVAYSELRGVVFNQLRELGKDDDVEIEPVAAVSPFSIINGAFVLRLLAEAYPPQTVFSVILNPVQHRPERIFGKTKKSDFIFIGANTGVFDWFLRDLGIEDLYELNDPGFLPFGGKFIHAPAVAKLASGVALNMLGRNFDANKLLALNIKPGTIVHVDNFGLMKISISLKEMREGEKINVLFKGKKIEAVFSRRMMSHDTGEWVIYPGSSLGLPELGRVRENGAAVLGAIPGDVLEVI